MTTKTTSPKQLDRGCSCARHGIMRGYVTASGDHDLSPGMDIRQTGNGSRRNPEVSSTLSRLPLCATALTRSASKPNLEAGGRLRIARERLHLSTRDVERLSRILAERRKNQEYYISHGWLTEIERGDFAPSIYKLCTLSSIYQCSLDQILAIFDIHIGDIAHEQLRLPLPYTYLVGEATLATERPTKILSRSISGIRQEKTDLVSRMFSGFSRLEAGIFPQENPEKSIYGYVGTKDFTLFPLIRPGSFVKIDSA